MPKKKEPDKPLLPPQLLISRSDARRRLEDRIVKGAAIRDLAINSREDYETAKQQFRKWDDFNGELLQRIFDNQTFAKEYNWYPGFGSVPLNPSLGQLIEQHRKNVITHITRLESLLERLDLVPEAPSAVSHTPAPAASSLSRQAFVVHGRDEAAKETVARFLEKLDLEPVILHEQPNRGRTIIEKFEDYSDVAFAVILLTPDDVGAPASTPGDLKPRARQNVILELGFFLAALGRSRVCPLYVGDVEIPSDYDGVVYVPLDSGGGWRLKLAAEIRAAGISVDLNRAI